MSIHDPVFDDRLTVILTPTARRDWENDAKRDFSPIFPIFIASGVK
jgi:hypothetical protein